MLIQFDRIEESVIPNFKDGEKDTILRKYEHSDGRIMRGKLVPGASIGMHCHETSDEVIYILQGNAVVLYENSRLELTAGECHYCPKGASHSLRNESSEDLMFLGVVGNR